MTASLIKCSKKKNKLYKRWLCSKNASHKILYLDYKRIYSKLLKKAEIDYYNEKFDLKVNNVKSIWKQINTLCNYSKSKGNNYVKQLIKDGTVVTEGDGISNVFNDFFSNVGACLANQLPKINDPS